MTTAVTQTDTNFVLTFDAVRRAINALKPLTIHETFPVYLHLRRRAAALGRFTDLQPDWWAEVHDWLDVPGGPPNKPHFRPFTSRGSSANSFWMNDNLAGSYAPSSLRGMRSLYVGPGDQYQLPTNTDGTPNPTPIANRLLGDKQVPAWAVAAFLFRNRSFSSDPSAEPSWLGLLAVFQTYFAWTQEERDQLFNWTTPTTDSFRELIVDA